MPASMDGAVVPTDLTVAKMKKDSFRDNFLFLSLQWKDLEEHYAAVHEALERKRNELSSTEESLREILLEVEAKQHEFEALEALIEEQCKDLDARADEYGEKYRLAIEKKGREIETAVERRLSEIEEKEKSFESQSASLQRLIDERFEEVARKEKKVEAVSAKLREQLAELKLKEKRYDERVREFELANLQYESDRVKLSERSREVESQEWWIEQRLDELDLKNQEVEERSRELELNKSRFERDRGVFNERFREFELKENQVERRAQELEKKNKQLEVRLGDLESRRRIFEVDRGKFEVGLRELESNMKKLASDSEKLDKESRELDSKAKKLEGQHKELVARKREFDERVQKFVITEFKTKFDREKLDDQFRESAVKEKQLEGRHKELESSKKAFEEQVEKFNLMERKLEETSKEVELKAKQYEEKCKNLENANLRGFVAVDGKSLQVLLNECRDDHDRIRDGVSFLLRMYPDPAKVVLDAMEGFFPPHLKKGVVEFKGSTVRASCILLLEQLMKISPDIKEDIKSEATKLSFDWFTKLKPDNNHSCQILGFLLLIASYNCHNAFDVNELFRYAKVIAHRRRVPELCRVLGFRDEIPGFIQDLLGKKQHLAALKFASRFDLLSEFPPRPIMKEFMDMSRSAFKAISDNENSSPEETVQIQATNKRIGDLKAAMRCIQDHKLNAGFSPVEIKKAISLLEKQLADRIKAAATVGNRTKLQESNDMRGSPRICSPVPSTVPVTANCSMAEKAVVIVAPDTLMRRQRSMEQSQPDKSQQAPQSILADNNQVQPMDAESEQLVGLPTHQDHLSKEDAPLDARSTTPKNAQSEHQHSPVDVGAEVLRQLLTGDMQDKLVQQKIVHLLKSSSEPADLAFDVIQGPHSSGSGKDESSSELGIPVKRSILLLKELKGFSYKVNPQLNQKARKFAMIYKSNLKKTKDNHIGVIFLLQFLDAFKVLLDANEVTCLLDPSVWCKEVPDSCQRHGLQDFIPNFIEGLIKKNQRLNAVKYIHAMELESRFPVVAILKDHLAHWENKGDELLRGQTVTIPVQNKAFDVRVAAAKDAIKCISLCKLESMYPSKELEEYIESLNKQKERMRKSEESEAAKPLAGTKRKSDYCDGERHTTEQASSTVASSISGSNTTIKSQPRWQKKRKTKFIGELDPDFVPPPPRKFYPKKQRFHGIASGPFVKPTGRAQFLDPEDDDGPFQSHFRADSGCGRYCH
ncbi:hypothetical protein CRG98_001372 [Punica granatum]|uniref:FRIGIDA-like protein 5 n=1 Tax=Punica granatum TaxID=22663 RepID=A0A2I0LC04_PUNGR|nr:hypothetical protein CRG98_001372 [Punica granatum]